jgi:hypothetical protein
MLLTCESYCCAAFTGDELPVTTASVADWISWEMRG